MTKTGILETVIPGWVLHSKQYFMTSNLFQTDRMCCSNGLGQRLIIGTDKERHRVSFRVNPFQSFGRIILPWTTNTHSPQTPMFWVPDRFVRIKEGRIQSNNVPGTILDGRINANHTGREVNWPIPPTPELVLLLAHTMQMFLGKCFLLLVFLLPGNTADGLATPFTMS